MCNGNVTKYNSSEVVELKIALPKGTENISLEGWSVDSVNENNACGVVFSIDGEKNFFYLSSRQGVANALNNPLYEKSGFSGNVDISHLEPGLYIMEMMTINHDCSGYYESLKIPLYIVQ